MQGRRELQKVGLGPRKELRLRGCMKEISTDGFPLAEIACMGLMLDSCDTWVVVAVPHTAHVVEHGVQVSSFVWSRSFSVLLFV